MDTTRTFIFAGGGTGGHLFPGLAIAQAIAGARGSGGTGVPSLHTHCLFLCSTRPLDSRILAAEGADFRTLPAQPPGLHPRRLARFLANWGSSVRLARQVIREHKARGPVHLVAMGGFVAAPAVQAARVERIPITLINLDAVPGRANRWIARHARRSARAGGAGVLTAAPVSAPYARDWKPIPPIIRREAVASRPAAECRHALGLDPARPTLMVTGGSQGARSVDDFMAAFARNHAAALGRWQVIHQCGADGEEPLRGVYASLGIPALVQPFVSRMADWWGAADLAVSRAGAGSVAEVWANRVPTLFLPYPFHRDQHQRSNAQPLVDAGGAAIATDLVDPARNLETAGPVLRALASDPTRRAAMRAALLRLGPADGADRAAMALLSA
jgi:UDP-N-acetylglucosamine--N-acetylmuramyl-(pentapeptide) pyrophosphoryl-undecaprenol N-acetylglucosamine transferase